MAAASNPEIIFQQLFEPNCSAYTYILADAQTLEGIIIDPVLETVDRDLNLMQELGIKLKYILDTHVHADHITGSGLIAQKTKATIAMSELAGTDCDIALKDGQILNCGSLQIKALSTPGHTNSCMCYHVGSMVFTGDALLVRGNGRTDFQGGSSERLYDSIMQKLYTLPDDITVYIAHDYNGFTSTSIGMEKKYNKRITSKTTKDEFVTTMSELKLALPKKIDIAVPANLHCGRS